MDEATTVVAARSAPDSPGDAGTPKPHRADPSMPVRSADLEPYPARLSIEAVQADGSGAVAASFSESDGLIAQGTAAIRRFLAKSAALGSLTAYGSGDLALSDRQRARHPGDSNFLGRQAIHKSRPAGPQSS